MLAQVNASLCSCYYGGEGVAGADDVQRSCVSFIEPTAEVGFWAWLPLTPSPSRAVEPGEIASDEPQLRLRAFINPCK